MRRAVVLLASLILVVVGPVQGQLEEVDRPVPVLDVHATAGELVELACDVSKTRASAGRWGSTGRAKPSRRWRPFESSSRTVWDHVDDEDDDGDDTSQEGEQNGAYLVLWFMDSEHKPVYSFDVRGRPVALGRHWWDERRFERRAHFLPPSPGRVSRLQIANVSVSDAGQYRCRVDYRNAPTRNFKYRLIVVEPPKAVVILDALQHVVTNVAGPIEEGKDLILTCRALGGHPTPWVTWWRGGQLLDNVTDARGPVSVSNLLVVPHITRADLHDAFTCQVTSSSHLPPIMKTVTLELNLGPLWIEMIVPVKGFVAGQSVDIRCQTAGSRPPPIVSWWKGSEQILYNDSVSVSADGNVTTSVLSLTPQPEDDRELVTCRAENGLIPSASLEDSTRLDILYAPIVRLSLGSNIIADDIKEGDDVYIECHIRSNPPFYRLLWSHDGSPLSHNVSAGIVLSNVSLVMRAVTRSRAGFYTCTVVNARGETTSQPLRLRIQYTPRCHTSHSRVIGVSKEEAAILDCRVDTDPPDVHFWWTFLGTPMRSNGTALITSSGDAILLPRTDFTSKGSRSSLKYTPKSELDYGVVACWASNSVGNQKEPCLFHVVPAGKPVAPSNCTVHNQTADSMRIDCLEAFDGGLQQTFGLELRDAGKRGHQVLYSLNSSRPTFTVYGLQPETAFLLSVFALNAKGRSHEVVLEAATLSMPEKHTGQWSMKMMPLLGVLVGAAVTLLFIVLVVAVVVHSRQKAKKRRQRQAESTEDDPAADPLQPNGSGSTPTPSGVLEVKINGNGRLHATCTPPLSQPSPRSSSPTVYHKDPDIILTDMDCHMKRVLPAIMKKAVTATNKTDSPQASPQALPQVASSPPWHRSVASPQSLPRATPSAQSWTSPQAVSQPRATPQVQSRGRNQVNAVGWWSHDVESPDSPPSPPHWDDHHLNQLMQRSNILSDSRLPESSL